MVQLSGEVAFDQLILRVAANLARNHRLMRAHAPHSSHDLQPTGVILSHIRIILFLGRYAV